MVVEDHAALDILFLYQPILVFHLLSELNGVLVMRILLQIFPQLGAFE